MNDHEDALGHFQICLLQRRRLLGCHVDVANVLYEMASIYAQQDRAQLAAKCMTESDRIYNATLKNNEKLTSVLLLSGKLWKTLGIYESAQTNFEQALEQAITVYGQEHELVARILLSLGELLQEKNEMTQALFCFDEFMDDCRAIDSSRLIDSPTSVSSCFSPATSSVRAAITASLSSVPAMFSRSPLA